MIAKIKSAFTYILGFITLILGALFYAQKRKTESVESDLAHEKSSTEIKLNDQAREAAKSNADALISEYERLKRDE